MDINFKDKTIVLTGGARGLGRDMATTLAKQGALVYVLDILEKELDELKGEFPNNIRPIKVDLTDWEAAQKAVESIPEKIDHLINNAAIGIIQDFLEVTPDTFDKTFAVNLRGVVAVSQMVAKKMIISGVKHGSIVNISSQIAHMTLESASIYCSSKAALMMLTKSMARELGPHKIRVNAVSPTFVKTELSRHYLEDTSKSGPVFNRIPLGKWADPDDVTNSVLFLLSDKAKMITGESLLVDGGYCAS